LVVCSAGNWPDGPNEPHYPSDYPSAMSVAAVSPDQHRAPYSFYGTAVDLAAPGGSGSDVAAQNITSSGLNGTSAVDFGTSFSAPHVVGAAALVLSQFSNFSARDVRTRLEGSASPLSDDGMGNGLVNAAAALGASAPIVIVPPATGSTVPAGLVAVNTDDLATLASTFKLLVITARLLIAHRPFQHLEDIRTTLGLTSYQYAAVAAYTG
jgi:subtilisin family serine protease